MRAFTFVLFWMSVNFVYGGAYKAGVIDSSNKDAVDIMSLVYEAGESNVDVLVLSDIVNSENNYEDAVKDLSEAAKQSALYLVAHLKEPIVCQKKHQIVRSNLVFDRQGSIIAVYRKPVTKSANCTIPTAEQTTFSTDFGVTFGLMMEEDLVLKTAGELKNFVVTGPWASEIQFLSAPQFIPAWSYVADVNVISSHGIYSARAGLKTTSERLVVADLDDNVKGKISKPPVVTPGSIKNFPGEDLGQYIIRPLDLDAASKGYRSSVCHNDFCCEFYAKINFKGPDTDLNYGLAAFDGARLYGGSQYISTQNCALFACAGLYKRSCDFGSINNSTNISFEKLTVTANFTIKNSIQYPVILSNEFLSSDRFSFDTKTDRNVKKVTVGLVGSENVLTFGIFGRDFENDYERNFENQNGAYSIYDYIFTDDLQDFFDYVWIRLRILIFVVSIYVLEMM